MYRRTPIKIIFNLKQNILKRTLTYTRTQIYILCELLTDVSLLTDDFHGKSCYRIY